MNTKAILETIKSEGLTEAKRVRGFLSYKYGVEGKEATAILSEAGFSTRTKGEGVGFIEVIDYLAEYPRTESDLYAFIAKEGTGNEARWITNRNTIRLVINDVFIQVPKFKDFKDKDATKAEVEAVKAKVPAKVKK